jgi:hypothetical protein
MMSVWRVLSSRTAWVVARWGSDLGSHLLVLMTHSSNWLRGRRGTVCSPSSGLSPASGRSISSGPELDKLRLVLEETHTEQPLSVLTEVNTLGVVNSQEPFGGSDKRVRRTPVSGFSPVEFRRYGS